MRTIIVLSLLFLACHAETPAPTKLTAGSILQQVKEKGARKVLQEYSSASLQWHAILKHIETGDAEWLAVASELRAVSDAGYSEDLDFSVATALPKNPSGVLRLKHFALERVCDVPYLEPSEKTVHDFQTKAAAALETVRDADLQDRKKKCRTILMAP